MSRPRIFTGLTKPPEHGDSPADEALEARQIAAAIVEPRRTHFDDILVYVHRVGGSADLAPRRVEWTPRGGYVEIVYR